jgi:hypothetical protein
LLRLGTLVVLVTAAIIVLGNAYVLPVFIEWENNTFDVLKC